MGDQCWFVARSVETRAPHRARLLWIEPIAAERVRTRVPELFRALGLRALCVDAGPLRDLSRDLAFALNDLGEDAAASTDDAARNIFFSRHGATLPLRWHAASERWENVRCLPVEFTQREGQGVRHKVARTQEGRIYPLLAAHRDESIARVIGELTGGDSARWSRAPTASPRARRARVSCFPPRPKRRAPCSISTNATCSRARGRSAAPTAARCATSTSARTIFFWRRRMPRWRNCWRRPWRPPTRARACPPSARWAPTHSRGRHADGAERRWAERS